MGEWLRRSGRRERGSGGQYRAAVRCEQRREHFAAMRVHPGRDGAGCTARLPGERFEGRDRRDRQRPREREALDGRDANAKPGEGARSDGNRQTIDVLERRARFTQHVHQFHRQTLAMRPRSVAGALDDDRAFAGHANRGRAAAGRRSVERENEHLPNRQSSLANLQCIITAIPANGVPSCVK